MLKQCIFAIFLRNLLKIFENSPAAWEAPPPSDVFEKGRKIIKEFIEIGHVKFKNIKSLYKIFMNIFARVWKKYKNNRKFLSDYGVLEAEPPDASEFL